MPKPVRDVTDEKFATLPRSGWQLIGVIAFWATTLIVVAELAAGSVWNLLRIEWIRIQLSHLGYPDYFAYILGAWHVGGAAAIMAPGFPRLKEWAYAGSFFLWSSAVVSHLCKGDFVHTSAWMTPLFFATCAIVSWALRPADRRLPNSGAPENRPRAWAISIAILVLLYVGSFLTLPMVQPALHERAVQLGWIAR